MKYTAVALAAIVLIPNRPGVGEDGPWWDPLIRTEDRIVTPRVPGPIPIIDAPSAGEPSLPPLESQPYRCRPNAPYPGTDISCDEPVEPSESEPPVVTEDDVREAMELTRLPKLRVNVQPAGSTLVNLETIFHTTAAPFERTVDILDSTVDLRAVPAAYTWHHGDGTTQTTTNPGRPYPAMDVIHQYKQPGNVTPSVDVTYRVTYRIDDGDWENLNTTITAPGPGTALRIREARPVLTN